MDPKTMTTEQYNFCQAVDVMMLDMIRRGKIPAFLVAYPGDLTRTWGEIPASLRGLTVVEHPNCRPGSFYLTDQQGSRRILEASAGC